MDSMLYTVSAGAREVMMSQMVLTNNLANASTPGFRKDIQFAQSSYVAGSGLQTRVIPGNRSQSFDATEGAIRSTGNPLDIAVNGEGWITVLAEDGTEALSRRGDLRINAVGQLINGAGNPIVGDNGPIAVPPFSQMNIGSDGTISIVPLGQDALSMAVIDRIKLVNPNKDTLEKGMNGLIQGANGGIFDPDAEVRLVSGSLESSNVNPIEMMVRMIELSRRLEGQVKLMGTIEEIDKSSTQLMRVS